ncbi:hypothetical protein CDIK_1950 [Cucumispora dikerogammari]|nr:hypothetical protein CDIK_1950 [Cucumispora dikerogammari]
MNKTRNLCCFYKIIQAPLLCEADKRENEEADITDFPGGNSYFGLSLNEILERTAQDYLLLEYDATKEPPTNFLEADDDMCNKLNIKTNPCIPKNISAVIHPIDVLFAAYSDSDSLKNSKNNKVENNEEFESYKNKSDKVHKNEIIYNSYKTDINYTEGDGRFNIGNKHQLIDKDITYQYSCAGGKQKYKTTRGLRFNPYDDRLIDTETNENPCENACIDESHQNFIPAIFKITESRHIHNNENVISTKTIISLKTSGLYSHETTILSERSYVKNECKSATVEKQWATIVPRFHGNSGVSRMKAEKKYYFNFIKTDVKLSHSGPNTCKN